MTAVDKTFHGKKKRDGVQVWKTDVLLVIRTGRLVLWGFWWQCCCCHWVFLSNYIYWLDLSSMCCAFRFLWTQQEKKIRVRCAGASELEDRLSKTCWADSIQHLKSEAHTVIWKYAVNCTHIYINIFPPIHLDRLLQFLLRSVNPLPVSSIPIRLLKEVLPLVSTLF